MTNSGNWTRIDNDLLPVLAKIGGNAIAVYVALKSFSNAKGECWPTHEQIQKRCGTSIPTIKRVIYALASNQLICKTTRNTGTGRTSCHYQFIDSPRVTESLGDGSPEITVSYGVGEPIDQNGIAHRSKQGEPIGHGDLLSRTTQEKPIRRTKRTRAPKAKPDTSSFEDWYDAYPRHIKRKPAEKAYESALKIVSHDKLLERTRLFAVSGQGCGPKQYIPYPATWLNDQQWDDDPEEWRRNGNGKSTNAITSTPHSDMTRLIANKIGADPYDPFLQQVTFLYHARKLSEDDVWGSAEITASKSRPKPVGYFRRVIESKLGDDDDGRKRLNDLLHIAPPVTEAKPDRARKAPKVQLRIPE